MTVTVTKKNCAENTPVILASHEEKSPAIDGLPPVQSESLDESYRKAMADSGIIMSDPIIKDGKLHRFHVTGDKAGSKNGCVRRQIILDTERKKIRCDSGSLRLMLSRSSLEVQLFS